MITVTENNLIKIGKEPMILLTLKRWQAIEELLSEREESRRYDRAVADNKNKRTISFKQVKGQLNLP